MRPLQCTFGHHKRIANCLISMFYGGGGKNTWEGMPEMTGEGAENLGTDWNLRNSQLGNIQCSQGRRDCLLEACMILFGSGSSDWPRLLNRICFAAPCVVSALTSAMDGNIVRSKIFRMPYNSMLFVQAVMLHQVWARSAASNVSQFRPLPWRHDIDCIQVAEFDFDMSKHQ
jgi:hypothetical protein